MSKFLHNDDNDNNDDAKAIVISQVFSENSQAKNYLDVSEESLSSGKH